jgi:cytochrome bd-type quinol oxidase subunit 2
MTRQVFRELLGQFSLVTGFLCLGLAVLLGCGLFRMPPTKSKDGGAEYVIALLFVVPLLILLSAILVWLGRRGCRARMSTWFWAAVAFTLIPWSISFFDFIGRGGGDGYQRALRTWGF